MGVLLDGERECECDGGAGFLSLGLVHLGHEPALLGARDLRDAAERVARGRAAGMMTGASDGTGGGGGGRRMGAGRGTGHEARAGHRGGR